MSLIHFSLGFVHLHYIKLPGVAVPVENSLHPSPATPLQTSPTRLCRPNTALCESGDVYISTVHSGITAARLPELGAFTARRSALILRGTWAATATARMTVTVRSRRTVRIRILGLASWVLQLWAAGYYCCACCRQTRCGGAVGLLRWRRSRRLGWACWVRESVVVPAMRHL